MSDARVTPVRASLLERRTLGGADATLAVLNLCVTLNVIMVLEIWWYLPIAMLLHAVLTFLTRADPFGRYVYLRYAKLASRYDPWPRAAKSRGKRPSDVEKLLC
jgi:type IV secretory pathway TrbD component